MINVIQSVFFNWSSSPPLLVSVQRQKPHAQKTLEFLLQHVHLGSTHPVPKCGCWIPSEKHPMFPSMLFWSLLQMSVTKGMGPVMLKPHIMSTLVHLLRSTPPRLKNSGASVSPNSCRALTLKKGYSSPTVLNMAHRLLCGCWGHPIGHTFEAVEVDGWL